MITKLSNLENHHFEPNLNEFCEYYGELVISFGCISRKLPTKRDIAYFEGEKTF